LAATERPRPSLAPRPTRRAIVSPRPPQPQAHAQHPPPFEKCAFPHPQQQTNNTKNSGSKYQRLARAAEADASLEQYAPFIVPSANFPQMLYCALTGQLIERSLDAVRRHLRGKKWAGAKARFAADKQGLRPEPSLSEFGVRLPGEERNKPRKKAAGGSEDEEEDDEDAPMAGGSSESGSGSDEEEDGKEDDGEEEEASEEQEAVARPAARSGDGGGKKPPRPTKQAAAPQKKKVVVAKRGGAVPAPAPPAAALAAPAPPTPGLAAAARATADGKKRNPTRPSKAKKVRA
jgi:hypothetical protein